MGAFFNGTGNNVVGGPGDTMQSPQSPGQQTQQQAQNPIYGQNSPFQPPAPPVGGGGFFGGKGGFGNIGQVYPGGGGAGGPPMATPGQDPTGFPGQVYPGGMQQMIDAQTNFLNNKIGSPGTINGVPYHPLSPPQPIPGGPGTINGVPVPRSGLGYLGPIMQPITAQTQQQFQGGLRPPPRNYRPPTAAVGAPTGIMFRR